MKLNSIKPLAFTILTLACSACSNSLPTQATDSLLIDFENDTDKKLILLENAQAKLQSNENGQSLVIKLASKDHHDASFTIQPDKPWDFSQYQNAAIALDIKNPSSSSTHVYIYTYDANNAFQLRNVVIPANSKNNYLIELKSLGLQVNSGIRNNPPSWQHDYVHTIWRGGVKQPDIGAISKIKFLVSGVLENKTLEIDNIKLVEPKQFDDNFLTGIVDKFGQNAKQEFERKVHSVAELQAFSQQEQQTLVDHPLPSRSKFNGWADGPKLKATGFYRTEKYQGKWSIVDPEGYLFFSNGIANIRMANTSTITGYDFDKKFIKQRDPKDYTPEDSIGLNRAPDSAIVSRHVSSDIRANMFTWLPSYQSEEAASFGYRREVHTGAIEHGETYSFYRANLARKYQTNDEALLMEKWRDTTIKRMHSWGFTSFGNWVDPSYYQLNRLPYFANGWIIGDFKTVSSGNDYWGAMPDVFDPVFAQRAEVTVKQIADEVQNNPWCVGVFIDNEKSWGSEWGPTAQYGIVINALTKQASESPIKQSFVTELKQRYANISQLNSAWQSNFASWQQLEAPYTVDVISDAMQQDFSALLYHYANKYFSIVANLLEQHMPNHMYMGPRFAHWAMTPEVRKAAAKWVDVMSYNYYREGIDQPYWNILTELDMPSIIGEFHNGSMDSGLFNPGLIHATNQADRGKKYQEYMYSVIDNPYFVGAHWFQYIDSPLTGRAYDGENYNVGFVNVADIPYQPLVDAAKEVNQTIYTRRFK
ncbi:beta-galactosidase [Catenovulum sp. 2E275]|uniref:beta-galactosidase n=1 Tax=Catenovulum sp. 2E275 TaxID=2980497 RepID=UPI0021D3C3CC|nr:beta-galactosidase [Catenovulum sp. 2E275]MCU4675626.1 beta-galactosidase [Catenovulum sp. 2E275]